MACCPTCWIGDPSQDNQYCKDMEVTGDSHCTYSHCGSVCYATENTELHYAWKGIIYQNLQWDAHQDG